jgi:hypothetical protein
MIDAIYKRKWPSVLYKLWHPKNQPDYDKFLNKCIYEQLITEEEIENIEEYIKVWGRYRK